MDVENSILYEDNHLFVINKPQGLSSLPNEGMDDVVTICKQFIKKRDSKAGRVFLHPVHRLDKKVSGILVMAKTSKALSRLNEQIRYKQWGKLYLCEVENKLPNDSGELIHYLIKRKFYSDVYSMEKTGSKKAVLLYKRVRDNFYEIDLKTGRYHQIRAQLSFIKCPIVGDKKYKSKRDQKGSHLHHYRLKFFHPVTKKEITIHSEPPFMNSY